ncbi:MAG: Gfo/Idh/MocA family oxidoreductase [Gemmatimonadaceae bacterium]|nr:Gfo/Idh/MocA family oxidoreductase [Gemmatimonadaceae bacterium]
MSTAKRVRVGVLGAGAWAEFAHVPGWQRDARCEVVAIADTIGERAQALAAKFGIADWSSDPEAVLSRADIDVVDICTPNHTHFDLTMRALAAGKHVLCEKPVAYDYRETRRAAALAREKGVRTKLGFTFRYAPAMRYMKALIDQGYVGTPFIFNGYEQNSQFLDPMNPLRQVDHTADQSILHVSSLEGYGAPVMDIGHLMMGSRFSSVVGTMRNFIPERMVRATGTMMRMNIDDGDVFIGDFASGAFGSIQTSFVTVGNYPGIEARVYGSKGALICRLVEEEGICEVLQGATADQVEFRELEVPAHFYPPGGTRRESWRTLFYANLIHSFINEIVDPSMPGEGDFDDGAHVQELINAVTLSVRERRWVDIPLPADAVVR